jgi:hypothetical protein
MHDKLNFFRQDFDHDGQALLCARHLELMREGLGTNWWEFPRESQKVARRGSVGWVEGPWSREHISLAGHLIRHAGESADYPATVDYITRDVLGHIQVSRATSKRRVIGHLRQWGVFTHEHMVPGQAVLRLITDKEYPANRGELCPLLASLSLRALVTGTKRAKLLGSGPQEINALEPKWAQRLPTLEEMPAGNWPANLYEIPARFYGLMRYDAAGLIGALVPVSGRGAVALTDYVKFRTAVLKQSSPNCNAT